MDNFSRLPDELLIYILSFLRTNEAAATSVLSSRWQHLWKLTGRIKICFNLSNLDEEDEGRRSYILNSVIYSFNDPISYPIHEIFIRDGYFSLDTALSTENWISFILSRHRVQVLDMGLVLWKCMYRFPPPSSRPCNYELINLYLDSCILSPNFQGFGSLRSISLCNCMVTEAAFASINQNCTSLEHLKLEALFGDKVLLISSALCNLKRLEILSCLHVRLLIIDSPNLAFLKCDGFVRLARLYIRVPMLKEVALLCDPKKTIPNTGCSPLDQLRYCSRLVGKIQNLKSQVKLDIDQYPLDHVKELSLCMASEGLTGLDAFLRACSSLESFSFAFGVHPGYWQVLPLAGLKHESLKKIQIVNFCRRPDHMLLLRYLIGIAVKLVEMEILISPICNDDVTIVKECIKEEIEDNLPSGAKLVILPPRMAEYW